MINQCHCCLRRPSAKDMMTPYTRVGITEIYSVMLEECFAIDVTVDNDGKSGICENCVGRLREACHFKLLVQHSQAKLREHLEMEKLVKDEEPSIVQTEEESEKICLHEELMIKPECEESDAANDEACISPASGDVAGAETGAPRPVSARARELLARACCVRLDRLRDSSSCPVTSPREASPPCAVTSPREASPASSVRGAPAHTPAPSADPQPYTCDTCGQQFRVKGSLSVHMSLQHKKSYSCHCCSKKFSDHSDYRKHKKTHKKLICDMCNKVLSTYDALVVHKRTHTGEKPYSCEYCDKRFSQLASLNSHMPQHTGIKKYNCKICNENFTRSGTLKRHHIRQHTGEKPFSCEICQKQFSTMDYLKIHKLIHLKEKPFACDVCGKRFIRLCYLNMHKGIHTERPRCFSCKMCNKMYLSKDTLRKHFLVHTRPDAFACDVCPKKFTEKYLMVMHKRIHKKRPYCCKICYKNFILSSHLRFHEQNYHGKKIVYVCDYCNKQIPNKIRLISHIKLHMAQKQYVCETCSLLVSSKTILERHIKKIHSSIKPYTCDICHEQCRYKRDLIKHITSHAGERPYSCDFCNKKFVSVLLRDIHEETHMGLNVKHRLARANDSL